MSLGSDVRIYYHPDGRRVSKNETLRYLLKGFKRLSLPPGETQRVEFTIGRDELKFWNIDMKDVVEPARLTVCTGHNSAEGACAEAEIGD